MIDLRSDTGWTNAEICSALGLRLVLFGLIEPRSRPR
jgi:hypothetical protein